MYLHTLTVHLEKSFFLIFNLSCKCIVFKVFSMFSKRNRMEIRFWAHYFKMYF